MGVQELGIVLLIVLVIFGGSQLPKLARNLGRAQQEFKDGLEAGQRDAGSTSNTSTTTTTTATPSPTIERRADEVTDTTARDDGTTTP